ncbi:MAG TPA: hypothetical protein VMU59_05090 [Caulobacteraceae bacterium]|nr:hypothetical protein [Caulobacteraceae bacterium]
MNDQSNAPAAVQADETPAQRALRLRKAALKARQGPPHGRHFHPDQVSGMPHGASKPQMRK